jgi:hypothetical protein
MRWRNWDELLAGNPHGTTETLLVRAYRFWSEIVARPVRAGLAMPNARP